MASQFSSFLLGSSFKNLLLSSVPKLRTSEEIEEILEILSTFPFFIEIKLNLGLDQLKNIINIMIIKEYNKGEEIIRLGDIPSACYIILEGHAQVFIPQIKNIDKNDKDILMVKIGEVTQGHLFGEKSLMTKGVRNASVITDEDSIVACLPKKEYLLIFNSLILQEQNEDFKLYRSMEIFKDKSKTFIEKFIYGMEKVDFKPNQKIIMQNEILNNIYIIRKGYFKLIRHNYKSKVIDYDLNFFCTGQEKLMDNERFTSNRLYEIKGEQKIKDVKELFVYGKGEIIGDIEMLCGLERSLFTAVTLEVGCQALICSRGKFLQMMGRYKKELVPPTKKKFKNLQKRLNVIRQYRKEHIPLEEQQFEFLVSSQLKKMTSLSKRIKRESSEITEHHHNLSGSRSNSKKLTIPTEIKNINEIIDYNKGFSCNNIKLSKSSLYTNKSKAVSQKKKVMKNVFRATKKTNTKILSNSKVNFQKLLSNDISIRSIKDKQKLSLKKNATISTNGKYQYNLSISKSESENSLFQSNYFTNRNNKYNGSETDNDRLLFFRNKKIELNLNSRLVSASKRKMTNSSDKHHKTIRDFSLFDDPISPLSTRVKTPGIYSSNNLFNDDIMKKKALIDKGTISSMLKEKYSLLRKNSFLGLYKSKT